MTIENKDLHVRFFEANDVPLRLAELEQTFVSLMTAGFKDQAERIKNVYAGLVDYAQENGLDVLLAEGLDSTKLAASDVMQTKLRYKKLKMKHKKTKKKWLCCKKPVLKKGRKGGRFWMSTCRYRDMRSRQIRVMNMMLGKDPSNKPKSVMVDNKKMRWCTGAAAK